MLKPCGRVGRFRSLLLAAVSVAAVSVAAVSIATVSVATASIAMPSPAEAQFSVEEERGVQVAAMSTGYAFGALHTVLSVYAFAEGEPLDRSWVAGSFMSTISFVGLSLGYITQAAAFTPDPNAAAAYGASAPPGILLGALNLALAIDSIDRGAGDFWMEPGPAVVTLVHGLSLSVFGFLLALLPNAERSPLENIVPIYTWAAAGALLAIYSVASLVASTTD